MFMLGCKEQSGGAETKKKMDERNTTSRGVTKENSNNSSEIQT